MIYFSSSYHRYNSSENTHGLLNFYKEVMFQLKIKNPPPKKKKKRERNNKNNLKWDFKQISYLFPPQVQVEKSPSCLIIEHLPCEKCETRLHGHTHKKITISSVQFSSVAQLCLILCDPMNHSMPGLPVYHQLPEFTQILVHQVGDTIQPSHPLSSPSPPAPNPFQYQGLFQWVNSSHEVAKVLEF